MSVSKYKKYTHLEHILARPDTYIGSLDIDVSKQWIFENGRMVEKEASFVSGLFKIFDEILVNALDQTTTNTNVDKIVVCVNESDGYISVMNTGDGIPVEMHEEHNMWVPELIFGNLLTSSNYDDSEARTTGGRNGYGAKLTNVFSKRFVLETCNVASSKKYVQEWSNNMKDKTKPKITSFSKSKGYTKITFYPDLQYFKMSSLNNGDISKLIERRTYDACACTPPNVKIYFNDTLLTYKTFDKYMDLFIGSKNDNARVVDISDDNRWFIGVAVSQTGFKHVSFVNGIHTSIGGSHIEYILSQIIRKVTEHIQSKNKDVKIKPQHIKDHLFLFVKATLVNPTFSSQTKTECTNRYRDFGSRYEISDEFVKKIIKLGFVSDIIALLKHHEQRELNKSDGRKTNVIRGIPKLEDANKAGTSQSAKCTLILTEGDSAKTFAISGLSIIGRDYYGVFPLKGKLLNVRDATPKQLLNNEEIGFIKQIVGLKQSRVYENVSELRYGKVMILTDADVDGSHIKGLFINLIHHFWPSLLHLSFITSMRTPILKLTKGARTVPFYTKQEYDEWARRNSKKGWHVKYYKGLGTSTSKEAKEYFKELDTNRIVYTYNGTRDNEAVVLAFKKTESDARKLWIQEGTVKNETLDTTEPRIAVADFVNKDLRWFSIADNIRSIPSMVDGLKPSQRKVLYACRKRTNTEIKVSQLSGYVSTETSYHHGEQSLMGTIVCMSQDYTGSNNINLLSPLGQFGTRLLGGKDAASPRYIFTRLMPIVDILFDSKDDPLLSYCEDDGLKIEPTYYVPTLPLILINGCEGIGTGYSTHVPCFNADDIKTNILKLLRSELPVAMKPWYKGFKGTIEELGNGKYVSRGSYHITHGNPNVLVVTELPVGKWTSDYKDYLDHLLDTNKIKAYTNNCTEVDVLFEIKLPPHFEMTGDDDSWLKLTSNLNINNMHLFNSKNIITKYETPLEILKEFVSVRLEFYNKRKTHLLNTWGEESEKLSEQIRFMKLVMSDEFVVFKNTAENINTQFEKFNFRECYRHMLLTIQLNAFSLENIKTLCAKHESIRHNIRELQEHSPKTLWLKDIEHI